MNIFIHKNFPIYSSYILFFYCSTQDVWVQTAKKNAELFEQVFGGKCIPTNSARNYDELEDFRVWNNYVNISE